MEASRLRARYRRIMTFFARATISFIAWELVLPRLGLRRGDVIRLAVNVCDERPSFLGDETGRGHIPWLEGQFPIAIETTCGNVAQVEGAAEKRKPGRPKGSKNKNKQEVVLNPELLRIQEMLQALLLVILEVLHIKYLVLDGHFGNYPSAYMARQANLHLISKMRSDVALYLPLEGKYGGSGRPAKYGSRVNVRKMDDKYLTETTIEDNMRTDIYQVTLLNKEFDFPLNVVVILKTNLDTQAQSHVILFSTDLDLSYEKIIAFYCLRFQIEFNFRDAKQYWGLEDFMNIEKTAVTNAANLSFFMVNLSHLLLRRFRQINPNYSLLDLKAHYHGCRYAAETIKMLPQKPDAILLADIFEQIARLGMIHPVFQPSTIT